MYAGSSCIVEPRGPSIFALVFPPFTVTKDWPSACSSSFSSSCPWTLALRLILVVILGFCRAYFVDFARTGALVCGVIRTCLSLSLVVRGEKSLAGLLTLSSTLDLPLAFAFLRFKLEMSGELIKGFPQKDPQKCSAFVLFNAFCKKGSFWCFF